MASSSSSSVSIAVFLLLSMVLVSASTDRKNVFASVSPSLEKGSLTESNGICDPKDVSSDRTWGPTQDCNICTFYCTGVCAGMGTPMVKKACTPNSKKSQIFCQCCCAKPPSPPPPPPSPPPPSLPPPTPSGGGPCGQPGDTSTETTIITSNCADCTNWCKEECSDAGSYVLDDKCEIGESKFARRCKCCCRENSTPPPPSCPTQGCPSDVTWTIPGVSPCKYRLLSSLSSSSSLVSM
ncbi:hypothetical protein MKW94_002924 [Papaver nudicaule]|uniref:Uncharacterized protein n=1 Tax=Papaver nudicaule TaxID=74823 RepID=A0AA41V037_PAPNU|nr:hypothetical protein [Papaver nudicaule]